MQNLISKLGIVLIGRNEGDRFIQCLQSVLPTCAKIVYVDSGSEDGSLEYANSIQIDTILLGRDLPFSAGRARNEGFFFLLSIYPDLEFIQFIDGDCTIIDGWIPTALEFLNANKSYAIVAGRRFERNPDSSIYNRFCDIEWNTPVGDTSTTGGDFMVRVQSFIDVDGFNPTIIAGEEPDLCFRLLQKGWKISRYNKPMTYHDAAITKWPQWFKRSIRSGHAYAQLAYLHRRGNGYRLRECFRIWLWALFIPCFILATIITKPTWGWLFISVYFVQIINIFRSLKDIDIEVKAKLLYTVSLVIIKFPQFIGQLKFFKTFITKKALKPIEYK